MTSARTDRSTHRQDVALFRYAVIAPLLSLEAGSSHARALRQQAARRWSIPGSTRTRVAANTIRDWIRIYHSHGFDGLLPRQRADASKTRRMDVEIPDVETIEALLAIKRADPGLSVRMVIEKARSTGAVAVGMPLPPTTVHRLFTNEGVMDMERRAPVERRRFSYAWAGELWMSDVMHGPKIRDRRGRKRKSYLISFLDDATRLVPYSAFCFSEATPDFLQVLRQAVLRRGLPVRLYVDNGAAYTSRQTALVCARLGIALIHARPRSPTGRAPSHTALHWVSSDKLRLEVPGFTRIRTGSEPAKCARWFPGRAGLTGLPTLPTRLSLQSGLSGKSPVRASVTPPDHHGRQDLRPYGQRFRWPDACRCRRGRVGGVTTTIHV